MEIIEKAYAKINLCLEVLGDRPDGYHEVRMIMQSLDFSDNVIIREGKGLELTTDSDHLPPKEGNLAYKAARLLAEKYSVEPNVHIELQKNIFISAGLAGGSTDAAAVLRGLNRFWGLSLSREELEKTGADLGMDVPFCIGGGTALAKGCGEIIVHVTDMPFTLVILARPKGLAVSTTWAYTNYDPTRVVQVPCAWAVMDHLRHGGKAITPFMGNVLETVTIPAHPEIASIKAAMLGAGAYYAMMSGSGPTVFALAHDKETADRIFDKLKEFDVERAVTTTKGRLDI
ncbi:MAG: 4-(cytidine 5'-diphospho)-2-C-methyl-D-erythritol kinase [Phascolarctobacterium sp.]|nr:4-(cytidine 5'-diphospho)-2-C-methyl-D-erythritol kinase [Phascolarctobacterium sp.]